MTHQALLEKLKALKIADRPLPLNAYEVTHNKAIDEAISIVREHLSGEETIECLAEWQLNRETKRVKDSGGAASWFHECFPETQNSYREWAKAAISVIMGGDEADGIALQVGSAPRSLDESQTPPAPNVESSDSIEVGSISRATNFKTMQLTPQLRWIRRAQTPYAPIMVLQQKSVCVEDMSEEWQDVQIDEKAHE